MYSSYDTTGTTMYSRSAMPTEVAVTGPVKNSINFHRARMGKRPLNDREISEHLRGAGIGSTLLNVGMQLLPALTSLLGSI